MLMQLIAATLITHNLPDSGTRMVQAVIILGAVFIQRQRSRRDDGDRRPGDRGLSPWRSATATTRREPPTGASASPACSSAAARSSSSRSSTILASLVFGTRFASVDNFLNILEASSFLGLVAVGMTFVIIGGGIDLSVGSLLALSAVLAAYGSQYGQRRGRRAAAGRLWRHRAGQRRCSSPEPGWPRSS